MLEPSTLWTYSDQYASYACSPPYKNEKALIEAQKLIIESISDYPEEAYHLFNNNEFTRPYLHLHLTNRVQYALDRGALDAVKPYLLNELRMKLLKNYDYDLSLFKPPELFIQMDIEDSERYVEGSFDEKEKEGWLRRKKNDLESLNLTNDEYLKRFLLNRIKNGAPDYI